MSKCPKITFIFICGISIVITIGFMIMIVLTVNQTTNPDLVLNSTTTSAGHGSTINDVVPEPTSARKPPCFSRNVCSSYSSDSLFYKSLSNITSPESCQEQCQIDEKCLYFTWTAAFDYCLLEAHTCEVWMEEMGQITGPKNCK